MNTLLNTKGLDISKPADFAKFVATAKAVQTQLDEAWGFVEQQMLDRDVSKVQGDWGSLSIAERKSWKAETQLPPRYYKQVLDTAKLNYLHKAGEKLPEGAFYTTSKYLTRRVK